MRVSKLKHLKKDLIPQYNISANNLNIMKKKFPPT